MTLFRGPDNNSNDLFNYIRGELILAVNCVNRSLESLTDLGYHNKDNLNTTLLLLSIGIERIMKLILILDYYHENKKMPDNNYLKRRSHNIAELLNSTIDIANKYSISNKELNGINNNIIMKNIIEILSNFALKTRYYNLDNLTGVTYDSPIKEWNNSVNYEIIKKHGTRWRIPKLPPELVKLIESSLFVRFTAWDDSQIKTFSSMHCNTELNKRIIKHVRYYIYNIIRGLLMVFDEMYQVDSEFSDLSFLSEIYGIYFNDSPEFIKNRKTWIN